MVPITTREYIIDTCKYILAVDDVPDDRMHVFVRKQFFITTIRFLYKESTDLRDINPMLPRLDLEHYNQYLHVDEVSHSICQSYAQVLTNHIYSEGQSTTAYPEYNSQ